MTLNDHFVTPFQYEVIVFGEEMAGGEEKVVKDNWRRKRLSARQSPGCCSIEIDELQFVVEDEIGDKNCFHYLWCQIQLEKIHKKWVCLAGILRFSGKV